MRIINSAGRDGAIRFTAIDRSPNFRGRVRLEWYRFYPVWLDFSEVSYCEWLEDQDRPDL